MILSMSITKHDRFLYCTVEACGYLAKKLAVDKYRFMY